MSVENISTKLHTLCKKELQENYKILFPDEYIFSVIKDERVNKEICKTKENNDLKFINKIDFISIFEDLFLKKTSGYILNDYKLNSESGIIKFEGKVLKFNNEVPHPYITPVESEGVGFIDAIVKSLNNVFKFDIDIEYYIQGAPLKGSCADVVTLIQIKDSDENIYSGAAKSVSASKSSIEALMSAINKKEEEV